MNFIDALQAKLKADELLQKEVRNLLAANPPDSVKCFAKNGLHAFADNGDTTEISEITLAWLTGMENAGATPSADLREFLQAESQHNGILRDAKMNAPPWPARRPRTWIRRTCISGRTNGKKSTRRTRERTPNASSSPAI